VFDWKNYHTLGLWLADNKSACGVDEANLRSAISRFYYGAFRFVRRRCEETASYTPTGSGSDHAALRRHLSRRNKFTLAERLEELQRWREQCDYDDEVPNLDILVEEAKEAAAQVYRLI
jgi:hypothetical protein